MSASLPKLGRSARGWPSFVWGILLAIFSLIGASGFLPWSLNWVSIVVLGMAFAFMGGAELLSKTRRRVVTALRVGAITGFILFLILLVAL